MSKNIKAGKELEPIDVDLCSFLLPPLTEFCHAAKSRYTCQANQLFTNKLAKDPVLITFPTGSKAY